MAHQVMLSWTGDFFNKPPQDMVTGAILTITDGEKIFQPYRRRIAAGYL